MISLFDRIMILMYRIVGHLVKAKLIKLGRIDDLRSTLLSSVENAWITNKLEARMVAWNDYKQMARARFTCVGTLCSYLDTREATRGG